MARSWILMMAMGLCGCTVSVAAQQQQTPLPPGWSPGTADHPPRPPMPTRDPHAHGYVAARELPDGTVPSANVDGDFILGPTHPAAKEMSAVGGVPQGTVIEFTMNSTDSKLYPGIAREPETFGMPDPNDPAKLIVTTSR